MRSAPPGQTRIATPSGGPTTTDVLGYPAGSNRVVDITRGATTVRSFTYDGAGNMLSDSRLGTRRVLVGIRRRH